MAWALSPAARSRVGGCRAGGVKVRIRHLRHAPIGCQLTMTSHYQAGAGPGNGAARKETMDYGGAVKLVEAAEKHGVRRYLMLSSMGAGNPGSGSEAMQPYLFAKARADERLQESDLDYTIIRPGSLTEEAGAGRIEEIGRA